MGERMRRWAAPQMWRRPLALAALITALALLVAGTGPMPVVAQPDPTTPTQVSPPQTPNDYYDLETRFLIDHTFDPINGGLYIALRQDGTPWGPVPEDIYGFPPGSFSGTTKHPGANAQCISYFLREFQRLSATGRTVTTKRFGVLGAADMLPFARNCANFVNTYGIIGRGQNEPQPLPTCTPGDGNKCVYYWGFLDATGRQQHLYPIPTSRSTVRYYNLADSFVAWNMALLATALFKLGDPAYATYEQAARDYWAWAERVGAPYAPRNPTFDDPSYEGRDQLWPALGMTLYDLSLARGAPEPAFRDDVLACVNQQGSYATSYNRRSRCNGTAYTTAFGRSAAYAQDLQQRGNDNYTSGLPIWHNFGSSHYGDNPDTPQSPFIPFVHGAGREFVAGAQRAHWFYYTFPSKPDPPDLLATIQVPGGWTIDTWSRRAIIRYWNYANTYMWDNTPGVESWWDAQDKLYKPCFSLGTPVPIADWLAPAIADKVHTLNPDGSASVSVTGVRDEPWPFLNWQFRGIGVDRVTVFFSIDAGATWSSIPASEIWTGSGLYIGTIPPQPGREVWYYAAATDALNNTSTFPAGAPAVYQTYSVPTAITLASFTATSEGEATVLRWSTSDERDHYGFVVHRAPVADQAAAQPLTQLIPAHGSASSYSYTDVGASAGSFYWLESIDLQGTSTFYGPIGGPSPTRTTEVYLPFVTNR